jgi:hypothetical protein
VLDVASSPPLTRLLGGFAVLATLVLPIAATALPASQTLAVIVSPGQDAAGIVARSGGTILRQGGWSNVLLVRAESSDLVARLYASGAWLVIDARSATACAPSSQT